MESVGCCGMLLILTFGFSQKALAFDRTSTERRLDAGFSRAFDLESCLEASWGGKSRSRASFRKKDKSKDQGQDQGQEREAKVGSVQGCTQNLLKRSERPPYPPILGWVSGQSQRFRVRGHSL